MTIQGYIDRVGDGRVEGWVCDAASPARRLVVEARADGRSLGLARADLFRRDVADLGCGDGYCGFSLDLAGDLPGPLDVGVYVANTEWAIPGSPVRLGPGRRRLKGEVDLVSGHGVMGWAMDPAEPARTLAIRLREGERIIATAAADRFRGDLADGGIGDHAFDVRLPLSLADGAEHVIHVEAADSGLAVPGSPVTYVGLPRGASAVLHSLHEAADPATRRRAMAVLGAYLARIDRSQPGSLSFGDYPAWFDHFMAGGGQEAAAADLFRVVDGGSAPSPAPLLAEMADRPNAFLLWLEPGSRLAPGALDQLARAVDDQADVVYGDWEEADGGRRIPHFLPDWSHHYLLSVDYLGPVVAFRAGSVRVQPGDGWIDVRLKALEAARTGGIRHVPRILGVARRHIGRGLPRASLEAHLVRAGLRAAVRAHPSIDGAWSIDFAPPQPLPLVSLVIPTRDKPDLLGPCVESLLARTAYPALELVVVDNASRDPETLRFLRAAQASGTLRVHRDDRPFNYSALNNAGVAAARGSIIGLLNNDVVVPSDCDPHWLHRIVGRLSAPEIGAVGIKLIYPSGLVQHAGVVVGVGDMAENAFKQLRADEPGYGGRAAVAHEVSAVTAAALFVDRETCQAVGGLDEVGLPVAFNDVDLCLKIGARGQRVVLDPEIVFLHLESASRGHGSSPETLARDVRERNTFQTRWRHVIDGDPYYNVNLNLDGLPYMGLAFPPRRWEKG
jgi:GT2 family glycosyltransferase